MKAVVAITLAVAGLYVSSTSYACNYWDRRDGACQPDWNVDTPAPVEKSMPHPWWPEPDKVKPIPHGDND